MFKEQESGRKGLRASDRRAGTERRRSSGRRRIDQDSYYESKAVLSVGEACCYIGISRPTFLKLIYEGRIRAQKMGRGWKVLKSEIERFLLGG